MEKIKYWLSYKDESIYAMNKINLQKKTSFQISCLMFSRIENADDRADDHQSTFLF